MEVSACSLKFTTPNAKPVLKELRGTALQLRARRKFCRYAHVTAGRFIISLESTKATGVLAIRSNRMFSRCLSIPN